MSLLSVILMAIVQGITEFLPISSDGHLAITNALLESLGGQPAPDLLEVTLILHLGTLASVLVFYRRELVQLLFRDRKAILPIIVATIPAVIVGLGIEKGLPDSISKPLLESPLLAGFGFLISAAALWWSTRCPQGDMHYTELPLGKAMLIGILQSIAILPGVSRSGMTISGGLGSRLSRTSSATFSFLMAVPVIAGAGLLKMIDLFQKGTTTTPIPNLAVGFVVSMIVGLAAIAVLIRFVQRGRLNWFVYYLVPLGIVVIVWQLAARAG
jgi:undecaprenyl-diphosphatase